MGTLADTKIKSPLFARKQAGGVFTVVNETLTTGNIFYVDSGQTTTGGTTSSYGRNPDTPFTTLTAALAACTASNGDMIFLMPGHAEAPTATITVNKIGVSIIGLGVGRNRPTFTPAHTVASDDTIDITADDVLIKNIIIAAGTNSGGNSTQLNVNADDFSMEDSLIEMGAKNLIGVSVVGGKHRARFERCVFRGTAANPDVAIDLEGSGKHNDMIIRDCHFNFDGSSGLDLAGVRSSKTDTGLLIKDCTFIGLDTAVLDFNSSATGLVVNCFADSNTGTGTVAELMDGGLLTFVETRIGEPQKSGARIPATTSTP